MKSNSNSLDKTQQIVFSVKEQSFCLSVQHVRSILKMPRVFPVPQSPDYIMGVVNVDGNVIPLINATIKLKMGGYKTPENPTILVLEREVENKIQLLGLHVDDVQNVVECNDHELRPLPTSKFEFDERLVDGMFQTPDDFVMKVNVNNFFKHNLEDLNPQFTQTIHVS